MWKHITVKILRSDPSIFVGFSAFFLVTLVLLLFLEFEPFRGPFHIFVILTRSFVFHIRTHTRRGIFFFFLFFTLTNESQSKMICRVTVAAVGCWHSLRMAELQLKKKKTKKCPSLASSRANQPATRAAMQNRCTKFAFSQNLVLHWKFIRGDVNACWDEVKLRHLADTFWSVHFWCFHWSSILILYL